MMAQPAKKVLEVNTLIIVFLPFHDEGEARMLEMRGTLFRFCDPELKSRSLQEMQILSASLSFVLAGL